MILAALVKTTGSREYYVTRHEHAGGGVTVITTNRLERATLFRLSYAGCEGLVSDPPMPDTLGTEFELTPVRLAEDRKG